MERCQEADCSAAACVWEDDWELSNNGQVQFLECVRVCVRACVYHIFPNAASPTRGFNRHVKACPRLAVPTAVCAAMEVVMHLVSEGEGVLHPFYYIKHANRIILRKIMPYFPPRHIIMLEKCTNHPNPK